MLKRTLALALSLLACIMPAFSQEDYTEALIPLTAKYFPDANFRAYLEAKNKSNVSTVSGVKMLDRTAVSEINLNFTNGKVNNIQVNYTSIKSLEGIKYLINLQTITLPAITKTTAYSLESLDVSGLKQLMKITNGSSHYKLSNHVVSGTYTPATKFKLPLKTIVANDCPRLSEICLNGYQSLESITLGGTTGPAVEEFYILNTGLKKLDVSNLVNLHNTIQIGSFIERYWTDYDDIVNANEGMKSYYTFSTKDCSELTELIVGDIDLKLLDVSYCDKLTSIDLSGLTNLVCFQAQFHQGTRTTKYSNNDKSTHYACDHSYTQASKGSLARIKVGAGHKHLRYFHVTGGKLTNAGIDIENLAPEMLDLSLNTNMLTAFDITPFKKLTELDLGYNRIHHLDLPPNKNINSLGLSDNCLTRMDQFKKGSTLVYSSLPGGGRIHPFQYIRKGKAYRYKIMDDPADGQYVEQADDTNNQKYYWAVNGGHIGNPDNDEKIFGGELTGRKEDSRYFYFDSPLTDGTYWYRNPYAKTDHFMHDWFKVQLCISEDIDFDPAVHTFYLVGEFNNWTPTDKHAFVFDEDDGIYKLQFDPDEILWGDFRVWNARTEAEASLNLGGHASEKSHPDYNGHGNHIYFNANHQHPVQTDVTRHFTRFREGETMATAQGLQSPLVEMSLVPGNGQSNWVRVSQGIPTGVDNISPDSEDFDNTAPVEYYNLQGERVNRDTAAPGIYIRRQGKNAVKIVI